MLYKLYKHELLIVLHDRFGRAVIVHSRKQKGSKNREKARIKVAKIQARITDSRKDHLHKLTTQLVRENQTIVVENLAVKDMVKNPKLSQAISDVSWGEITRQLAYKCRWYGRNYIKI
ncbi:transposase (fragment) [Microcystis aeruginosa PCC 9806]|uniref:Transposase n=1 Tax=Microcystis aeruginosa PCC 9806 TaxID=1160282 RepID=I4GTG3_MICAE